MGIITTYGYLAHILIRQDNPDDNDDEARGDSEPRCPLCKTYMEPPDLIVIPFPWRVPRKVKAKHCMLREGWG